MKHNFLGKVGTRILAGLLILSGAFLGYVKYEQWQEYQSLQKQITLLQQEAKNIEAQNSDLEQSLQLLASDSASERIARMQLNLKKEGEEAVVFMAPETKSAENAPLEHKSNFRLWWEYFFLNE